MEEKRDDPRLIVRELKAALQDAHFAARRLELVVPAPADARPADRIHDLRIDAGSLAARIEKLLAA